MRLWRGRGTRGRRSAWLALVAAGCGALVTCQYTLGQRSPKIAAEQIARGEALYAALCEACHGPSLEGAAIPATLPPPPLVKSTFHQLFLVLPYSMEGWIGDQIAEGGNGMPAFGASLSVEDRAALAYLIHVRNRSAR